MSDNWAYCGGRDERLANSGAAANIRLPPRPVLVQTSGFANPTACAATVREYASGPGDPDRKPFPSEVVMRVSLLLLLFVASALGPT